MEEKFVYFFKISVLFLITMLFYAFFGAEFTSLFLFFFFAFENDKYNTNYLKF